jgi:hypothetical protein
MAEETMALGGGQCLLKRTGFSSPINNVHETEPKEADDGKLLLARYLELSNGDERKKEYNDIQCQIQRGHGHVKSSPVDRELAYPEVLNGCRGKCSGLSDLSQYVFPWIR